jgi:hypothetical protein
MVARMSDMGSSSNSVASLYSPPPQGGPVMQPQAFADLARLLTVVRDFRLI